MPRIDDYTKTIALDQQFKQMSDAQFREFASAPEMNERWKQYTIAEKTAFLNRALMLDEDPAAFENEVLNTDEPVSMMAEGSPQIKQTLQNRKDPVSPVSQETARSFQYDLYRDILYTDPDARPLASDITTNMSPQAIIQNHEALRGHLVGHLRVSVSLSKEEKKEYLDFLKTEKEEFVQKLGKGEYRLQEEIQADLAEDFTVEDPAGELSVTRHFAEGDPKELLDGFDAEETSAEEKQNKLLSYVFADFSNKEFTSHIQALQKDPQAVKLVKEYASLAKSKDVVSDAKIFRQYLDIHHAAPESGMRLARKIQKFKEDQGLVKKQSVQMISGGDDIYADFKKESQRRAEQKQLEEAQKKAKEDLMKTGGNLGADSRGRTWAIYAEQHKLQPGVRYTKAQLQDRLAKLLLANRIMLYNGEQPENPIAFNLKGAREQAKKLQNTFGFKGICTTHGQLEYFVENNQNDGVKLAQTARGFREPFHGMTFKQRQDTLKVLKEMKALMDGPQGRSEKWRQLRASLDSLDTFKPRDNQNPQENGEKKLEEILKGTIDYMKGKKSLRRHQPDQNRFDQSLDILTELGKATPYAKNISKALYDRIHEVRVGHDATYDGPNDYHYGADRIREHSNQPAAEKQAAQEPSIHL